MRAILSGQRQGLFIYKSEDDGCSEIPPPRLVLECPVVFVAVHEHPVVLADVRGQPLVFVGVRFKSDTRSVLNF
jgi:hypothetical protein